MGLLKKFKNIFVEEYDDEEEEVVQMPSNFESRIPTRVETTPIKTEPNKMVAPKIEEKKENLEIQSTNQKPIEKIEKDIPIHVEEEKIKIEPIQPKKEEKFVFPVYFDDSDFDTMVNNKEEKPKPKVEIPKREERKEIKEVKKESSYKEAYNNKRATLTEDKKVFKPTPIISPVYGVLDKNYYKEDIVVTTSVSRVYSPINGKAMSIDDVRKKAFGTLEDDLENSIVTDEMAIENSNVEEDNSDIFNAADFESAVEEDKKRDIAKDGLKSDIEALLNNDEFVNAINLRKTKIEEPTIDDEGDEVIPTEEEFEAKQKKNKAKENIEEENTLVDDIMALAESGIDEENEITDKTEENGNDNDEETYGDELPVNDSDEIELPVNITDNEINEAYEDVSDLNDSDLFNLIDSMYDKEDK